jgi:predicted membrane metal-binding protein
MLLFSISFLIGISQLLWLPVINIYWLIFTVPFYIFVFLAQKRHFNLKLIILGVNLGFSWGLINGYIAKKQQLKTIPINNIEIKGTIIGLPVLTKLTDGGVKTKFSFKIDDENTELPIKKVLVSWYNSDQKIQAGQLWTLNLKLKPIHGYKNPGSFDYSKWLFRQGYDATATVKSAMSHQQSNQSLFNWVDQKRTDISQLIDESFQ